MQHRLFSEENKEFEQNWTHLSSLAYVNVQKVPFRSEQYGLWADLSSQNEEISAKSWEKCTFTC